MTFHKGAHIFKEDEKVEGIYLLHDGDVEYEVSLYKYRDQQSSRQNWMRPEMFNNNDLLRKKVRKTILVFERN